ncbi:hypothetical protein LguiA_010699 [Lonicera macranthoides]
MEAQSEYTNNNHSNNNTSSSSSWSCTANWTISHGSLHTCITLDSSVYPAVDSSVTLNSPLLLKSSPSCDYGPCEIKISFTQKHEIRQVYVRSTARVYEIYYAPDLQSNNEYLCTVRCGIAEREGELLHAADIEEAVHSDSKESKVEIVEEKAMNGINNSSSEDDWVEVKVPHSPVLDNGNGSLPKKTSATTRSIQEFYEATAEISDADPCISLTLRLLSLQTKERVFVDEIYVYADPVESSYSENQGAVKAENSAGSSLMAMLAPTLLQLSKSGISRSKETQPSTDEKRECQENKSKATELNNTADHIPNHEKSNRFEGERNYGNVAKNENQYSRFEGVLERLETRVSRIEDMLLRFEETMIKPINGIEMGLQQVEQQLEVLSKNSQHPPVFPSCTRFSAPAFSSMESYSSSYNEGTEFPPCRESEQEKDSPANKISKSAGQTSTPVSAPQFLPSLVVTAPEFQCGDEEENADSKSSKDSLEKQKKSLSIDDALAAALAGFSSMNIVRSPKSTEILEVNGNDDLSNYTPPPRDTIPVSTNEPSKYTQTLKVTAPEFTVEENFNDDKVASPSIKKSNLSDSFDANISKCVSVLVSTPCGEDAKAGIKTIDDAVFEETAEGVSGGDQAYQSCTDCSSVGTGIGASSPRAKQDLAEDDQQIIEETREEEGKSVPERDAFVVDFETPILDVKFVSRENSSSKSPLEALLGDAGEIHREENDNYVVLGDGETETRNESGLLVDLESSTSGVGKVESDGAGDKVTLDNKHEEVFESLI